MAVDKEALRAAWLSFSVLEEGGDFPIYRLGFRYTHKA
jgi:hypothetical protein